MSAPAALPRAGERFLIGVPGTRVDGGFRALAEEYGFSDFILFAHNCASFEQTARLTEELHAIARANRGTAALVAIDQEGGRVQRIPKDIINTPCAAELAAEGEEAVRAAGERIGKTLRSLGINMDLAPVLDIASPDAKGAIGDRSFGQTPGDAARNGLAMMRGLRDGGVLSCAKHFPGHGGTDIDTHTALPSVKTDMEGLMAGPAVPFAVAVAAGIPAVMSAHIVFPKIEKDVPATMSKTLLTGLLRQRLGFDGLIITDDLEMGAVARSMSPESAALASLCAGADIALVSHDISAASRAAGAVGRALDAGTLCGKEHEKTVQRKRGVLEWLGM